MKESINGQDLAKICRVVSRTVRGWGEDGHIVKLGKDSYELESAFRFYANKLHEAIAKLEEENARLKNNPENAGSNNPSFRKLVAEARLTEAKADIAELERDKLKGSLILLEDAIKDFSNLVLKVRAKFLAIPARLSLELSGMVEPRAIAALLQTTIDEALNELSEELRNPTTDDDTTEQAG